MEILGKVYGQLDPREIEEIKDIEAISTQCGDGSISCEDCPLSLTEGCFADMCSLVLKRNEELRG